MNCGMVRFKITQRLHAGEYEKLAGVVEMPTQCNAALAPDSRRKRLLKHLIGCFVLLVRYMRWPCMRDSTFLPRM